MRLTIFFLFLCSFTLHAQIGPRLIVRGDDMGYSHSGNVALIKAYTEGIETSIEVIVPAPWFPEAVKMLKEHPGVDVGIHLALTSEWDNMKWRPLTDCPSVRDEDGYFYPMTFPNENYPGQALKDKELNLKEVEQEFRAQIEMGMKYIAGVSHISGHMGCTFLSDEIRELTQQLADEYGLLFQPKELAQTMMGFEGSAKSSEEKIEHFINRLDQLEPGKTYLFVEHPGLANAELQAIHHIGYENVAFDRQGVTDVFTSNKVKAFIKEKGIQLISYKDLKN